MDLATTDASERRRARKLAAAAERSADGLHAPSDDQTRQRDHGGASADPAAELEPLALEAADESPRDDPAGAEDDQSGAARRRRARAATMAPADTPLEPLVGSSALEPLVSDEPNGRGSPRGVEDEQSGAARRRRARAATKAPADAPLEPLVGSSALEPLVGDEPNGRDRSERRRARQKADEPARSRGDAELEAARAQSAGRRRANRANAEAPEESGPLRQPGEALLGGTQAGAGSGQPSASEAPSGGGGLRAVLGARGREGGAAGRDDADSDDEALPAFDRAALFASGSAAAASFEAASAARHVLSVCVHRTDELPADLWIIHPTVRVYLLDARTGKLLRKSDRERPATTAHEQATVGGRARGLSVILPTQTQPFSLKGQRARLPAWEEELLLNEEFAHVLHPDALLVFELLDFAPSASDKHLAERTAGGWYRVAWAFLRPVAQSATASNLHRQMPIRLQLYRHQLPPAAAAPGSPRASARAPAVWAEYARGSHVTYPSTLFVTVGAVPPPPLQAVVYPYRPMAAHHVETGRLTLDELAQAPGYGGEPGATGGPGGPGPTAAERAAELLCQPTELPNALCFAHQCGGVGAKALAFSPTGEWLAVATLREGAAFSGASAAAGCVCLYEASTGRLRHALPADGHSHAHLVHDLAWLGDETALISASSDGTAKVWPLAQLLSAAAAASALGASAPQLADGGGSDERAPAATAAGPRALQPLVLQHGCAVYAALFLPPADAHGAGADGADGAQRCLTGALDGAVRIWALRADGPAVERRLERHRAGVNCLALSADASRLVSADGEGVVHVWSAEGPNSGAVASAGARRQPQGAQPASRAPRASADGAGARRPNRALAQSARGLFDWVASPGARLSGLAGKPIDSVRYHPSGKRLLIGVRDNQLLAYDLRLQVVLRHYAGLRCSGAPVRSVYSPDGRFVLAGSEDGEARVWHEETATALALPQPAVPPAALAPLTGVDWSPLDSAIACCAFARGAPVVSWAFDPYAGANPSLDALEASLHALALARPASPNLLSGRASGRAQLRQSGGGAGARASARAAGGLGAVAQRLSFKSRPNTPEDARGASRGLAASGLSGARATPGEQRAPSPGAEAAVGRGGGGRWSRRAPALAAADERPGAAEAEPPTEAPAEEQDAGVALRAAASEAQAAEAGAIPGSAGDAGNEGADDAAAGSAARTSRRARRSET